MARTQGFWRAPARLRARNRARTCQRPRGMPMSECLVADAVAPATCPWAELLARAAPQTDHACSLTSFQGCARGRDDEIIASIASHVAEFDIRAREPITSDIACRLALDVSDHRTIVPTEDGEAPPTLNGRRRTLCHSAPVGSPANRSRIPSPFVSSSGQSDPPHPYVVVAGRGIASAISGRAGAVLKSPASDLPR